MANVQWLTVWRRRAFRAWLVLALPGALIFAGLAVATHVEAARHYAQAQRDYDLVNAWLKAHAPPVQVQLPISAEPWVGLSADADAPDGLDKEQRDRRHAASALDSAAHRLDADALESALYAAILVLLAPASWLGLRVAGWVWEVPTDASPARLWPKYWNHIGLAAAATAAAALVAAVAPDRAIDVALQAVFTAVGVGGLAWLISKLRLRWR